jgi:uncharacterized protein
MFWFVSGDSHKKLQLLMNTLRDMQSVAIAYSGGVDSTFLCKVAYDSLGNNALAVTATAATYPQRELTEARQYAQEIGIKHIIILTMDNNNDQFTQNSKERCYYCKKELFTKIKQIAEERNVQYVLDGSTVDDTSDYRPGKKALQELGIESPLQTVGFSKQEIRSLSHDLQLPTWDKPSFACLASRFPYGTRITQSRLQQVEAAETFLQDLGIKQFRVRYHDTIARIEVPNKDFNSILKHSETIVVKFKELGFTYIALDIQGYRTGSLNEGITK